jgi:hypothetical protein
MKRTLISVVMALSVIGTSMSYADPVAQEFAYTKKTTLAFPATYTLRFSLWDAETLGNEVWSEEKPVHMTSAALKTNLGDATPLDPTHFTKQLWIEVQRKKPDLTYRAVGTREKLTATAYAINAMLPPASPYAKTIIVSPVGTEAENGTALLDAMSEITDVSATNP